MTKNIQRAEAIFISILILLSVVCLVHLGIAAAKIFRGGFCGV